MEIKRIHREDCKSSRWSGGTTTEFFLYPADGSYADRDFQVRVSSATVDLEESVFTSLPGVERWLTILKGEMRLIHTGRYEKELTPFVVEHFYGDWETKSIGRVVDFNLMLKDGAKGEMHCLEIPSGESISLADKGEADTLFFFAAEGSFQIESKETAEAISTGEAALLRGWKSAGAALANRGKETARIIVCTLQLQ